jgi:hypothetical protein
MKNKSLFLIIGQFGLAISILLNHFVKTSSSISFIIGLLTGLSIVSNLALIIEYRKEKEKK